MIISTDSKYSTSGEGGFTKSKPSELSLATLDSPSIIELKDYPGSAHVSEIPNLVIQQKPESLFEEISIEQQPQLPRN